MSTEYVIVCKRVDNKSPYTSSTVGHCKECGLPVWVSDSTPKAGGATCICLQCLELGDSDVLLEPTEEQRKAVRETIEKWKT